MKKTLQTIAAVVLTVSMLSPLAAFAQTNNPIGDTGNIQNQAPVSTLSGATSSLAKIVNWVIVIFWVLTVLFLIWAAVLYLTGAGNEEKIKEAKNRVIYAIIAAAIALLSTGLQTIVKSALSGTLS